MKIIFIIGIVLVITIAFAVGVFYFLLGEKINSGVTQTSKDDRKVSVASPPIIRADFSDINPEFLFSAQIPVSLKLEYLPKRKAINIYNSALTGKDNLEKSQMYVSFFKANKFLTLNTVKITKQDKMTVQGHDAILYEITKKDGVPDFYGQPIWRNFKHEALDIRLSSESPTYFYSFAKNPSMDQKVFDDFVNSLIFIDN